jgi:hypothetical protein
VTFWQRLRNYLMLQGRDPATWRGICMSVTGFTGWTHASEENHVAIVAFIGMFVVGLIDVLTPPPPPPPPPKPNDNHGP